MQDTMPKAGAAPEGERKPPAHGPCLRLLPAAPGHQRFVVEAFIRRRFAEEHAARITRFMPSLFGLHASDGSLHGAVGLRRAATGPLFLERYLDLPIEQAIEARCGEAVARGEIAEVGNLAADGRGTARRLIVSLAGQLGGQGVRWVAFTATPALLNSFRRLGLALHRLGPADPARIGPERADWGRYYDCRPQVVAGRLCDDLFPRSASPGAVGAEPPTFPLRFHAARP